jgi:hypothetical protein
VYKSLLEWQALGEDGNGVSCLGVVYIMDHEVVPCQRAFSMVTLHGNISMVLNAFLKSLGP